MRVPRTPGSAARNRLRPLATAMPRLRRKARIPLAMAVRSPTRRERPRCKACRSSCSAVLAATKRMVGRCTASAIASASRKSFLLPLRYLDIAGRHQSGIVAEGLEPPAQVVGADAGLHPDQAGRQVGELGFELPARQLPAQDDGAALIEADEVEGVLADVDAEDGDGVVDWRGMAGLVTRLPPFDAGYCGRTAGPSH